MATGCLRRPIMYLASNWLLWCCLAVCWCAVAFGLVGNVLSYRILGYSKARQRQVSSLYLRSLAVADCLALVFGVFGMSVNMMLWPALGLNPSGGHPLTGATHTYPLCNLRLYLSFSTNLTAVYIIVAFSVKRCLVVRRPFYWMKALTVRRSRATLALLVAGCFAVSLPALFSYEPRPLLGQAANCSHGCPQYCRLNLRIFKPFVVIESALQFGVPFVSTALCNLAIVAKVRQRDAKGLTPASSCSHLQQQPQQQQQQQQPDRAVTKRLLMVSGAFLLLTLPRCLFHVVSLVMPGSYCNTAMANFLTVAMTLNSLNYAVNFMIYCISELQFWRLAKALVLCQRHRLQRLLSFVHEPPARTRESTPTMLAGSQGRRTSSTNVDSESLKLQRPPAGAERPELGLLVSRTALAYVQVQLRKSSEDLAASSCDPRLCSLARDTGYASGLFAESECPQPQVLRWSEVAPD